MTTHRDRLYVFGGNHFRGSSGMHFKQLSFALSVTLKNQAIFFLVGPAPFVLDIPKIELFLQITMTCLNASTICRAQTSGLKSRRCSQDSQTLESPSTTTEFMSQEATGRLLLFLSIF